MGKKRRPKLRKKGMPPGTLVYTGHRTHAPVQTVSLWYDNDGHEERDDYVPEFFQKPEGVAWVDVRSVSAPEFIARIGHDFHIHLLAQEDILDTQQRAKLEEYDNGLFFILHSLRLDKETLDLFSEQIALFFGQNFLVSFQENPDDNFKALRTRVCEGPERLRKKSPDFLAYSLIDIVVDEYYLVLDEIELAVEALEENFYRNSEKIGPADKARIFHLKRVLGQIRHYLLPLRDASQRFYRTDNDLVQANTRPYLRDVFDHVSQILDSTDSYRELLSNIEALYQAEVANRLNNVMRLLTVISTIFIPLSFVAGVYGMNFKHMPELQWRYGYFVILGLMFIAMIGMLIYFRRKRWI